MGVSRNLQAVSKVHFQILFTWQEIHQGKWKNSRCTVHFYKLWALKYVSDHSMLLFRFPDHTFVVYLRNTKVTTIAFSRNSLYSFYSRNPTCETPPPMPSDFVNTPHSFRIPVQRTPLPFGNPRSRPWYRYGYFLESPNKQGLLANQNADSEYNV